MQEELQQNILTYRILEARLDALVKQRSLVINKILEIASTLESINEIKESGEVLFSLGSNAYTKGKITDKEKIIVEIGANIALEKNVEEAKNTLEKRKKELEESLREIENEIGKITFSLQILSEKIKELAEKAK